jgi:hypothetical protein
MERYQEVYHPAAGRSRRKSKAIVSKIKKKPRR